MSRQPWPRRMATAALAVALLIVGCKGKTVQIACATTAHSHAGPNGTCACDKGYASVVDASGVASCTPTSCTDQCQPSGSTTCAQGEIRGCLPAAAGCLRWSAPLACSDHQCRNETDCLTAPDGAAPQIIDFVPSPSTILAATPQSVTWTWSYAGAPWPFPTCTIDPIVGTAQSGDAASVTQATAITYTLTCVNDLGSSAAQTTIDIASALSAPVISTFSATPNPVTAGGPASVVWTWHYATLPVPEPSCEIDHGIGVLSSADTTTIVLSANETFTLTCTNAAGIGTAQTTIAIKPPAKPHLFTFGAQPALVKAGTPTTMHWAWTFDNDPSPVPSCAIAPAVGAIASGTTSDVVLTADTTFVLTCTNDVGADTANVTIFVASEPGSPAIAHFEATPGVLATNIPTAVQWSWTYASPAAPPSVCTIDHGVGTVTNCASTPVTLTQDTTFTLTCTNLVGSASAQGVLHATSTLAAPVLTALTAAPDLVLPNVVTPVTWRWTYANDPVPPPDCLIDQGVGPLTSGSLTTVSIPAAPTVFTLTCTNPAGSDTGQVTLTPPPLLAATAIVAGERHFCAITPTAEVVCWGSNSQGQLGDTTLVARSTPVKVAGLAGITAVAAGGTHTCALTAAGGLLCWGGNNAGQLGDGTSAARGQPASVVGLSSGVVAVAAGEAHTCALTDLGAVRCWGDNLYGALGDGTGWQQRLTPYPVSGLSSGIRAIAAGASYSCAITDAGGAKCWGKNQFGELGDGTKAIRNSPFDVVGLSSGVSAISLTNYDFDAHTCALVGTNVLCWGSNQQGELGDGTTTSHLMPTAVSGLGAAASAISTGAYRGCALVAGGVVKCWGNNYDTQLGDGTIWNRWTPVQVLGLAPDVVALACGFEATCALRGGGEVDCWGHNYYGELGIGADVGRATPVDVAGLTSQVAAVSTGPSFGCALGTSGGVMCWGVNASGQLGDGTYLSHAQPVAVTGLGGTAIALATGGSHACALTTAGAVECWGGNGAGQLGDGTTSARTAPAEVLGLASPVASIAAGSSHTCALTTLGGVICWGSDAYGQLGDGVPSASSPPVQIAGLPAGIVAIVAGNYYTCALDGQGGVTCWGDNVFGQLGNGTASRLPSPVVGLPDGAVALAAGDSHTCAVTRTRTLACWGSNDQHQLGDGTVIPRNTAVAVKGLPPGVSAVATGWSHTCALTGSGSVFCWGANYAGQVGNGRRVEQPTPAGVLGLSSGVAAVAASGDYSCALTSGGGVKCWGDDEYGETTGWFPGYARPVLSP